MWEYNKCEDNSADLDSAIKLSVLQRRVLHWQQVEAEQRCRKQHTRTPQVHEQRLSKHADGRICCHTLAEVCVSTKRSWDFVTENTRIFSL